MINRNSIVCMISTQLFFAREKASFARLVNGKMLPLCNNIACNKLTECGRRVGDKFIASYTLTL